MHADPGDEHEEADGRRQAVGRGRRGDPDDDVADVADRALLQLRRIG